MIGSAGSSGVIMTGAATVNLATNSLTTPIAYNINNAGAVLNYSAAKALGTKTRTAGVVNNLAIPSSYPVTAKNADYTIDPLTEALLLTYQVNNDIVITIPLSSSMPNDGHIREYIIYHLGSGTGKVTIQASGAEIFENGASSLVLNNKGDSIRFGIGYPNLGQGIALMSAPRVTAQARYPGNWASANFVNPTAVPFDTFDKESDTNVLEWDDVNPSRLKINVTGSVQLSFAIAIDSTGGATYNVQAYLRLNGTTLLPGSNTVTGNYAGEDQSLTIPNLEYKFTAGDYVELIIDHASLTGNANNILLNAKYSK
jgi:hypothetical protein